MKMQCEKKKINVLNTIQTQRIAIKMFAVNTLNNQVIQIDSKVIPVINDINAARNILV